MKIFDIIYIETMKNTKGILPQQKGSECTLTIKEMLQAGKTPQDLIKEINDAQREINAENNKREELKDAFVKACIEYYSAIYGREPEPEYVGFFVDRIEKAEKEIPKKKSTTAKKSDEEIIQDFVNKILDGTIMFEDKIW